jgi:predicted PhzF superfamily epimerase YddE/YHI9
VPLVQEIAEAFNITPIKCLKGGDDYLLLYSKQSEIEALRPDFKKLMRLESRAVIVTAPGEKVDFVSRFFAPGVGIDEDPVTGSAHTVLIPFWAERLGKTKMEALQLSKRGGRIYCQLKDERVEIGGKAVTYLKGEIEI